MRSSARRWLGFLPGNQYWNIFLRTVVYVALALTGSLLLGYPVAYYISRHAKRTKMLLIALIVLPLLGLLHDADAGLGEPVLAQRLREQVPALDPSRHRRRRIGSAATTPRWCSGLIYGYIPYLILPLLAALDRIDRSVLEAARDLGASPASAFFHVTLPLSKPGILGASVIIALPMFGDYYRRPSSPARRAPRCSATRSTSSSTAGRSLRSAPR